MFPFFFPLPFFSCSFLLHFIIKITVVREVFLSLVSSWRLIPKCQLRHLTLCSIFLQYSIRLNQPSYTYLFNLEINIVYYVQHLELHFFFVVLFKTHFTKERTFKRDLGKTVHCQSVRECILHVSYMSVVLTLSKLEASMLSSHWYNSRSYDFFLFYNPRHITDSFQIKTRMPFFSALYHRLTIIYHSLCTKKASPL